MNKYIGENFYKVKDKLKNKGSTTEEILFKKNILIGNNKNLGNIHIECEIKKIDLSTCAVFKGNTNEILYIGYKKETINHKKISKYITLSISGNTNFSGGQILNDLKDLENKDKKIKRIIEIWREYHLNDLKPNCIHQKSFNCNVDNYKELAEIENKKCPYNYKYGSKWLIKIIPKKILKEIQDLFNSYPVVSKRC